MVTRDVDRANDVSRARLAALAASLSPGDLEADAGGGWTVGPLDRSLHRADHLAQIERALDRARHG